MTATIELTRIRIEHFRKIKEATAELGRLNVIVGGNNSGKSSFLQGIHFSVGAAVAARQTGKETFTQNTLQYCPAEDFKVLRHGLPYQNQSNFGRLSVHAAHQQGEAAVEYSITIYRGRNDGNIGCRRSGDYKLGAIVTDPLSPFSVYVPGLAGIPREEELRSEGVVRRGVAGGDANLYLRNVLYLIKQKGMLEKLLSRMRQIFPAFNLRISFDQKADVNVRVYVSSASSPVDRPIETVGTGVLQALQIFSYITLFEPTLLLLDEPDSHLHPNNQILLARALIAAASEFETQIICSTHSRHLVDALSDDANFIWLRNGLIAEQGRHLPRLPLLLDLGAVDGLDRIRAGEIDWFILTEDADIGPLRVLLRSAGFNLDRCELRSYSTSSKLQSAIDLAAYVKDSSPATKVLIHRDRDFMTDFEVEIVRDKIRSSGAYPFITKGSDIESYFVSAEHIARIGGWRVPEVQTYLDGLAASMHVGLQHAFTRKRDEIKYSMYRGRADQCPDTIALLGDAVPLKPMSRLGKEMLKGVRKSFSENQVVVELVQSSDALDVEDLRALLA